VSCQIDPSVPRSRPTKKQSIPTTFQTPLGGDDDAAPLWPGQLAWALHWREARSLVAARTAPDPASVLVKVEIEIAIKVGTAVYAPDPNREALWGRQPHSRMRDQ
jgi:hypothetical protein